MVRVSSAVGGEFQTVVVDCTFPWQQRVVTGSSLRPGKTLPYKHPRQPVCILNYIHAIRIRDVLCANDSISMVPSTPWTSNTSQRKTYTYAGAFDRDTDVGRPLGGGGGAGLVAREQHRIRSGA